MSKKKFESIRTLATPPEIAGCFEHIAEPIDEMIYERWSENQTLADLRDTLLPKLLFRQDPHWMCRGYCGCEPMRENQEIGASPELEKIMDRLRSVMPELRQRHGIETLEVFGSWVHGDASPRSDLDLLVTFREKPGLIELVEIECEISELLGIDVDLVMRTAIKPQLRPEILGDAVRV